jgi:MOSC domain-containing protein YiiM
MRLIAINVALPAEYAYGEHRVVTGGYKQTVMSARLHRRGLEGDGQADLANHGSPDQAVLAFDFDHYPFWQAKLGCTLTPGAFSENLTVAGATETEICVGDIFQVGEAVIQATQPRQPCSKLARKLGEPRLVDWVIAARQGGVYFRVLSEGMVGPDSPFELIAPHGDRISIATVSDVIYDRVQDRALIRHLAELPEFPAAARDRMTKKLARS